MTNTSAPSNKLSSKPSDDNTKGNIIKTTRVPSQNNTKELTKKKIEPFLNVSENTAGSSSENALCMFCLKNHGQSFMCMQSINEYSKNKNKK